MKFNPKKIEAERKDNAKKGLKLLQEYIDRYEKTEYSSVDNELIATLTRGLKLLDINYVITPDTIEVCPDCKYPSGKVGLKGLSLHTHFGMNTLCLYCSAIHSQESIFKHNYGNCDHPIEEFDKNGKRQWTKKDCLHMYDDYVYYWKKITKELENA